MSDIARGGGEVGGEVKRRLPGRKNTCESWKPRESRVPMGLQKPPGMNDGVHRKPGLDHEMSVNKAGRDMIDEKEQVVIHSN